MVSVLPAHPAVPFLPELGSQGPSLSQLGLTQLSLELRGLSWLGPLGGCPRRSPAPALVAQPCLPLLLSKSPLLLNPHCEENLSDTSTAKVSQSNLC